MKKAIQLSFGERKPQVMMLFSEATFIGIDPTAGERPLVYAALDHELTLVACAEGSLDDVLAFAAGQAQAVVAVCAPRQPNQGVMKDESVRASLTPQPNPGRWTEFRLVEYLLRLRNISTYRTPGEAAECPGWMQMGFNLFSRLTGLGYQIYPHAISLRQCLEVYPHASFTVMLGHAPFPKQSLEGRLQRQLLLYEQGINLPDPMRFFEEVTRHWLLKGVLPFDDVCSPGELDALVAAYTAWKTIANQPPEVTLIGDPAEGQIVLPVSTLKKKY